MVIACDTSFLFSLYGNDAHSHKAVAWSAQNTSAIYLNSLTHYELGNALRFSEFRRAIQPGSAALYWADFETAISQGRLILATSNLADVVDEARRISAAFTLAGGHRAFDILHVASAIQLKASHFLTFDENQKKLAVAAGLCSPL